jgi:hypothetical protein
MPTQRVVHPPNLDPAVAATARKTFHERLSRLTRIAAIPGAPSPVVCMGVTLVLRSALILYGEVMVRDLLNTFLTDTRAAAGLCGFCGERQTDPHFRDMCRKCLEAAEAFEKLAGPEGVTES